MEGRNEGRNLYLAKVLIHKRANTIEYESFKETVYETVRVFQTTNNNLIKLAAYVRKGHKV